MAGRDQGALDDLMGQLLAAYQRADERIAAALREIGEEERHASRRSRLRSLRAEVDRLRASLDDDARAWVDNEFRTSYALGGAATAADVGAEFAWTAPHEAAIKTLAAETLDSLLAATEHMAQDAKKLVRAAVKKETLDKLLLGQTAVQASRELRGELAQRGISAVVYKNGARHGVGDYASMVVRTQSAIAYNIGSLTEGTQQGAKYAVAVDGSGCGLTGHNSGPAANGLVLPIRQAMQYPVAHPNCRRSWSPLVNVETVKEAERLKRAGLLAPTAEQQADEATADVARTAARQKHNARLAARSRRLVARSSRLSSRQS